MGQSDVEMIVEMQMTVNWYASQMGMFLFDKWMVDDWLKFIGIMLFCIVLGALIEVVGPLVEKKSRLMQNIGAFVMKILGYTAMLSVMSYNVWVVLVLVISQGVTQFLVRKLFLKK